MRGALLLLFVVACAPEEIVIASVADPKPACANSGDCKPDELCAKKTCGDARGVCELRPLGCGVERGDVCGCDGVQYWNDCLRRVAGEAASSPGPCGPRARTCMRDPDCPEAAFCARLGPPGICPPPEAPGRCWIIPADCGAPSGDRAVTCGPGERRCVDACTAIRSQLPHAQTLRCPM